MRSCSPESDSGRRAAGCTFHLAAAAALLIVAPAWAQPSFTPLGDLPGGSAHSEAWGVSADGNTVVGASIISGNVLFGGTYAAFAWTAQTGITDIYHLEIIGSICRAYAANANGSVIVGSADYGVISPTQIVAFIWTEETGTVEIGDLPGGASGSPRSYARGVSADGTIIAGQGESDSGNDAFRYTTADDVFLGLGDLAGGDFSSSGFGISADGSTIVGSSASASGVQAFRWNASQGIVGLGYLPTAPGITPFSEAYAASANGSVIVGLSRSLASGNSGWEAFRWTQASGMMGLGDLPGGAVLSAAYATTPNGAIVVGRAGVQGNCSPFGCQTAGRPFIWDAQHGLRDLTVVLTDLGVNLSGWELTEARGISANGHVIVGTGRNPAGNVEAWRADLGAPPIPIGGDFDADGDIDLQDYAALPACLTGPNAGPPTPSCVAFDFEPDDDVDLRDVAAFANVFTGS
jgi:probable HAF family extracellular repeat protein